MLLTEEDAKTKWCHRAGISMGFTQKCIGSACMAWRIGGQKDERFFVPGPTDEQRARAAAEGAAHCEAHWAFRVIPLGYCGLAGKVEP